MSERGIFDVRVWVEADDVRAVYALATDLVLLMRQVAPEGVQVRYSQLRAGHPLCKFQPSLEPKHVVKYPDGNEALDGDGRWAA